MEMKEVLSREGRDAKNLVVYQICGDKPEDGAQLELKSAALAAYRKPPVAPSKSPNCLLATHTPKKALSPSRVCSKQSTGPRVRSASTGRDKKSELQARYWALLFGNLQRAVNEIYQTVECYEHISSCQEAILVLENYVRDFKALSEWFKVSWDYESRPLQQRPHSLAWEVRKSNPVPRVRAKSLSSPTISGKSSPCLCRCNSGKTSPCCGQDTLSPRKGLRAYDTMPRGAMRVNVRELFASSKRQSGERQLSTPEQKKELDPAQTESVLAELPDRRHQYAQTDLEDDHLTLADIREKMKREQEEAELEAKEHDRLQQEEQVLVMSTHNAHPQLQQESKLRTNESDVNWSPAFTANCEMLNGETLKDEQRDPSALELTVKKLEDMENQVLLQDATKKPTPPSAELRKIEKIELVTGIQCKPDATTSQVTDNAKKANASTVVSAVATAAQHSPLKYSSVLNRPAAIPRTGTKTTSLRTAANAAVLKTTGVSKATSNTSLRRAATTPTVTRAAAPGFTARSGGTRTQTQQQQQQRPTSKTEGYGPPVHVGTRLSGRSRTMVEMSTGDAKTAASLQPTSRNSTQITTLRRYSREDMGSSSSTLKASNERLTSARNEERRSEPKQMSTDANDGWLTVKHRRRSSMHWSSRFHQPTGYASLPTLALLNEQRGGEEEHQRREQQLQRSKPTTTVTPPPAAIATSTAAITKTMKSTKSSQKLSTEKPAKVALRPEIKNAKAKVNSLPLQRKNISLSQQAKQASSAPSTARNNNNNAAVASRQSNIKRQKSDLTGLKMTSLHKEYMRSEKFAQRQQQAVSQQNSTATSSVETVVEGASNGVQDYVGLGPETAENGEQHKIDIKIQTNRDFSRTIGDLYESISLTAKAAALYTNGAGDAGEGGVGNSSLLDSCDENEESLANDMECDEDQRMLLEEQESLERQIRELESTEIDVDTETDETDCEVVLEQDGQENEELVRSQQLMDNISSMMCMPAVHEDEELADTNLSLELRYQALLSDMSWGEREEALATLQAYVARHPGRAQELHQKLSSPSRRRSLQETLKKYQAKQARAQQKRELLQKEKTVKIQQLLARVEDVKAAKQQLIEHKRLKMEGRLQRAAENREQYLRQIIEKAHDEEKKLKEINFIKHIEAQNKRLDLIESSKETEGRLQDLEQERQKRLEEKAAKEAAVERRRQELEQARQRKLEKMNETRLEKEQRIGKMQEQKERERQALAREKARDREERLLALQAQQQQTTEQLQRKILQKQKESARRHEENIEHIRQRALELTIPLRSVDENGQPRAEGGMENVGEDGDLSSTVSDVGSREHTRAYKKKMKKLKQRMSQNAEDYLKELQPLPLHMKRESQVPKYLNLVGKGGGVQGMERSLGQLLRLMAKAQVFDFQCFLLMDGLGLITEHVICKGMQNDSDITKKAVVLAIQLYRNACTLCPQIGRHALLGNSVISLFDALFQSLQLPEEKSPQHPVELSTELMLACTVALSPSYTKKHTHPKVLQRLPDLISYAVITGLVEILSRRCMKIRESIENHQSVVLSLLATLGFLTRFVDICPVGPSDYTRFLSAAKSTELFGSISMLNAAVVPIGECIPPRTISLAAATFNLLVSMAVLDLVTFQDVMSTEAISLKFLDVVTILLKYCGNKCSAAKNSETQAVIIDLIATIGFFCANNRKNQDLLTSEQCSIIIKSLTKLPEHLNVVVYPCLVTITFQNQAARNVISRDFNLEFLDEYSKSDKAKKNHLVALLKDTT